MRFFRFKIVAFLFTVAALAQSDRGTITGTVSDPTGAVVVSAAISARNTQTGAVYEAATTATGNYTLSEMPAGVYNLSVSASGFTKYIQQGIEVLGAQTLRIDTVLEVGATTESVTVTADASLLRTETSDVSHNITVQRIDDLPLFNTMMGAAGAGGLRGPFSFLSTMPGAVIDRTGGGQGMPNIRVNGLPNNTFSSLVDGQESTNTTQPANLLNLA